MDDLKSFAIEVFLPTAAVGAVVVVVVAALITASAGCFTYGEWHYDHLDTGNGGAICALGDTGLLAECSDIRVSAPCPE